jgi:hypothetical protein
MTNHRWMILLFLVLPLVVFAQPDSVWTHWYGGAGTDNGYAVLETPDHGLAIAGETRSYGAGGSDFWLIKTDSTGDTLWTRTYGGTSDETCYGMAQTSDGGFVLAGRSNSFGGSWGGYLVRTNSTGDTIWTHKYGGAARDEFAAVLPTSDNGFVLGGYTISYGAGSGDFWLLKVNANGDSLWSHTYGGALSDQCYSLTATVDGGYLLAGSSESFGNGHSQSPDFWLVKASSTGDSLWSRTFGGDSMDVCYSITPFGNGYALGGYTQSYGAGNSDFWVVKVSSTGDSITSRTFGTIRQDFCQAIRQTSDGGLLISGDVDNGAAGGSNFWLIKANANLDSMWNSVSGGVSVEHCRAVIETHASDFVMAGSTYSYGTGIPNVWVVESATPSAFITAFPDSVNFDTVLLGSFAETTLIIRNTGTYPANVTDVQMPEGYSTTFSGDAVVPPSGNLPVLIRLDPPTEGLYNDTVRVISSAPNSPFMVRVYGICLVPTQIIVTTPDSINFGSLLVGTQRDTLLHIRNIGTAVTHVISILPPHGFTTTYLGDHAIQSGAEITATIRFMPDSAGIFDDSLRIISTSPDSPTLVPVRGIGLSSAVPERTGTTLPRDFALTAFPNPFNPVTQLRFDVPKAGRVMLAVYDVNGRLAEMLADDVFAAGRYSMEFDGSRFSSGVYFARLQSRDHSVTQKLIVMK